MFDFVEGDLDGLIRRDDFLILFIKFQEKKVLLTVRVAAYIFRRTVLTRSERFFQ